MAIARASRGRPASPSKPVYAGDYSQTLIKALTAIKAGDGPQFSVLLAAEMHSLQDQDILVSLDEIGLDADAKKWLDGFYPAFMANSHADGKTWSVPFQRSTAVFYYNKAAFQDAGSTPRSSRPPGPALAAAAQKLTKRDASGQVTRWGIKMAVRPRQCAVDVRRARQPGRADPDERGGHRGLFQSAEDHRGDGVLAEPVRAKYHATPDGVSNWPQLSPDFLEGNTAIIQLTTGGLTNFLAKAKFPFGVAGLAGKNSPHTVVGGGNMYFFKSASPAERAAQFAVRTLDQRSQSMPRIGRSRPAISPPARPRMRRRR